MSRGKIVCKKREKKASHGVELRQQKVIRDPMKEH